MVARVILSHWPLFILLCFLRTLADPYKGSSFRFNSTSICKIVEALPRKIGLSRWSGPLERNQIKSTLVALYTPHPLPLSMLFLVPLIDMSKSIQHWLGGRGGCEGISSALVKQERNSMEFLKVFATACSFIIFWSDKKGKVNGSSQVDLPIQSYHCTFK